MIAAISTEVFTVAFWLELNKSTFPLLASTGSQGLWGTQIEIYPVLNLFPKKPSSAPVNINPPITRKDESVSTA